MDSTEYESTIANVSNSLMKLEQNVQESGKLIAEIRKQLSTLKRLYSDEADAKVYTYCQVMLANTDKPLHYIVPEGMTVQPGDVVNVPLGKNNTSRKGKVISVGLYMEEAAPYPPCFTKMIQSREDELFRISQQLCGSAR